MTHSLRPLLVLPLVALFGCHKKEAAPPVAPATSNGESSAPAKPAATMPSGAPVATTTVSSPARAPTPVAGELPIIAKARAYVGTEAALNRVHSIHYTGKLVATSPGLSAQVEIIIQQPDQQRVTIRSDKTIETTALDGYDGWSRTTAASDPTVWKQTILNADGIKRLRANTWENVAFYRGIEREGGSVQDQGPAKIDGIACEKVAFIHAPNIVFYRYFDVNTGRLVFSENEAGGTIRQDGEIVTGGIRLPKTIVTVSPVAGGKSQTVTITFDHITLNENFPESDFAVPSLANDQPSAAKLRSAATKLQPAPAKP